MKTITEAKPGWSRGGIAVVCEKCTAVRYGQDFPEHAGDERLADVKGYLKGRLKSEGRSGPIRIVSSSCLDVCARGGLTAFLQPLGADAGDSHCVVVDALEGRDALYERIVTDLSPRAPAAR